VAVYNCFSITDVCLTSKKGITVGQPDKKKEDITLNMLKTSKPMLLFKEVVSCHHMEVKCKTGKETLKLTKMTPLKTHIMTLRNPKHPIVAAYCSRDEEERETSTLSSGDRSSGYSFVS